MLPHSDKIEWRISTELGQCSSLRFNVKIEPCSKRTPTYQNQAMMKISPHNPFCRSPPVYFPRWSCSSISRATKSREISHFSLGQNEKSENSRLFVSLAFALTKSKSHLKRLHCRVESRIEREERELSATSSRRRTARHSKYLFT